MASTSSSDLNEQLSEEVENTVDSNSESDISDNWAVIDEDSSLEWNNEIKYEIRRPRHNFRNEQSDEESIEVVPEDSDAVFLHPDSDVILLPPMKEEKSASNEDIHTVTSMPHAPIEADQRRTDQKMMQHRNQILIGVITGVFALGCLWMLHADKFENSTPTSARVLVTKLQLENQFLRSQLRYVYTSLRSSISKTKTRIPYNMTKGTFSNSSNSFRSLVYEFVLSTQRNSPKDYCFASDEQHVTNSNTKITSNERRPTWTDKDINNIQSTTESATSFSNAQVTESQEKLAQTINEPMTHKNENKTKFEERETNSNLHNTISKSNAFHHKASLRKPTIGIRTIEIVSEEDGYMAGDESLTDPCPMTKLRNSIETIYALTPLLSSESQAMLPPKSQLLNSLAQNVEVLDSLLEGRGIGHDGIANFKTDMQNSTHMLVNYIDQSIHNLVENIAFRVQESQNKIQNQFCSLKTNFEIENIALLNWQGKPIFQDCSTFKEGYTDEYMKTSSGMEEINIGKDRSSERDRSAVKSMAKDVYTNQNFETEDGENEEGSFYSTSDVFDGDNRKTHSRKTGNQDAYSEKHKGRFSKKYSKKEDLKVKKIKKSKSKENNEDKKRKTNYSKSMSKKSKEQMSKDYTKYDKKKNYKKEKYPAYNLNKEKKFKFNKQGNEEAYNVSGEWVTKLAHGREEQRRRNHESDWVFDRAQSRNSNREKSKNHKQETCWFYGKEYNQ